MKSICEVPVVLHSPECCYTCIQTQSKCDPPTGAGHKLSAIENLGATEVFT